MVLGLQDVGGPYRSGEDLPRRLSVILFWVQMPPLNRPYPRSVLVHKLTCPQDEHPGLHPRQASHKSTLFRHQDSRGGRTVLTTALRW